MIAITVIGSGSKGNCSFLELGSKYYLLDAGLSCKKITGFLNEKNISLEKLSGIFLTHEHSDHVSGLKVLLKKCNLPVYATKGTFSALQAKGIEISYPKFLSADKSEPVDDSICYPFKIPHDASEPIGYRFENNGKTLVVATDIGKVTDEVLEHMNKADLLCLESNYDEDMLKWCTYPGWLKRRIKSPMGHLPNSGVRGFLSMIQKSPEIVLLMHVSQESNTKALVRKNIDKFIDNSGNKFKNTRIYIASQNEYSPRLHISSALNASLKEKLLDINSDKLNTVVSA